jgi:hypothetical protein
MQYQREDDHIVVLHNYRDRAHSPAPPHFNPHKVYNEEEGSYPTPFPIKLHRMLERVTADGVDHIVSWQPHGRCFVIHKPKEFAPLLTRYFALKKVSSFQRQLNLYGFQRMTQGPDKNGYYHEYFLRNRVYLVDYIRRTKVKGTKVRARSSPDTEPDFWQMPWIEPQLATNESDNGVKDDSVSRSMDSNCIGTSDGVPKIISEHTIVAPKSPTQSSFHSYAYIQVSDHWNQLDRKSSCASLSSHPSSNGLGHYQSTTTQPCVGELLDHTYDESCAEAQHFLLHHTTSAASIDTSNALQESRESDHFLQFMKQSSMDVVAGCSSLEHYSQNTEAFKADTTADDIIELFSDPLTTFLETLDTNEDNPSGADGSGF